MNMPPVAIFRLGRLLATPNALRALTKADINKAVGRHQAADWGDVGEEDRDRNDRALQTGGRLFSVYHGASGAKFYVITEHDRTVTTVLLPEDY